MYRRLFLKRWAQAAILLGISRAGILKPEPAEADSEKSKSKDEIIRGIYKYIEERFAEHTKKIQEFLRQPSVSGENRGVRECAEMLRQYFADLGCREAELVQTDGHPGVFAYYDAGAPKTLAVYMMYDTQPFDEKEWSSPPLAANIVERPPFGKVIIARGAINSKGPLRAFLNSLEAIRAVAGNLPVNLIFTAEGEEELGSPHLYQIVAKYQSRLKEAGAVIYPSAAQDRDGKITMSLGNKGISYIELECSGKKWGRGPEEWEVHSSTKAVLDSPVLRLIHALCTFTSEDGNRCLVEGFYDAVAEPSEEDKELIDKLVERFDEDTWKKTWKVSRFIDHKDRRDLIIKYLYSPTFNIDGIWAGYSGPGTKTILPHKAEAKIDMRLVPNMDPKDIVPMIRAHLDKHGYEDIEIRERVKGYWWSKTSVKSPVVQAVLSVYRRSGIEPIIWPHGAGSSPSYLYTQAPLNLPYVSVGLGHGGGAHSVDEYYVVEQSAKYAGLIGAEKSFVDFLYTYADWSG